MLFILFCFSFSIDIPKFSQLIIGKSFNEKEMEALLANVKKNPEEACKEDEEEGYELSPDELQYCISLYKAFQQIKVSEDGSDINDKLKLFSKDNELLVINGVFTTEIDFNNLKSQMAVTINAFPTDEGDEDEARTLVKKMIKAKFDGTFKSLMRLGPINKRKVKADDETGDDEDEYCGSVISMIGNVKDKVSYLALYGAELKVVKSDLNVNSIYFGACSYFHSGTKKATSNLIVASFHMHSTLMKAKQHFDTEQYGLYLDIDLGESPDINFASKEWVVIDHYKRKYNIPYEYAKKFNLVTVSDEFKVNCEDKTLDNFLPINISIYDESELVGRALLENQKSKIKITGTGWEGIPMDKRPKIDLIYDTNDYELDESSKDLFQISENTKTEPEKPPKKKNKTGMIVGIVVALVVVIVIVVVVVVIVIRKKKAAADSASQQEQDDQ